MKTCTSVSLPEQFGVQFFKVHKDTTLSRPQEDPLDFLTFRTAYRFMVRERKVKRNFCPSLCRTLVLQQALLTTSRIVARQYRTAEILQFCIILNPKRHSATHIRLKGNLAHTVTSNINKQIMCCCFFFFVQMFALYIIDINYFLYFTHHSPSKSIEILILKNIYTPLCEAQMKRQIYLYHDLFECHCSFYHSCIHILSTPIGFCLSLWNIRISE